MSRRTDRVGNLIQREISGIILRELRDSRIGFVTISNVDVATDLSIAKVFFTVMGGEKEQRDTLQGLKSSASYLRTHLAKVMHTRTVPKLVFQPDPSLDQGYRIEKIIRELNEEDADPNDRTKDGSQSD